MTVPADDRVDTDEIKRNIDLREFVAGDVNTTPKERGSGYWKFNCPLGHRDSDPSFVCWQDHFKCFSCGAAGDVFTYIQARTGKTFKEAVAYITGDAELPKYKPKEIPVEKKLFSMTMEEVERYRANIEWVAEYLRYRRISEAIADIEMLGASRYSHRYLDSDGKEWSFQCNRLVIPYMFGNSVYSVNFRRDDLSAKKWLQRMGEQNGMDMEQFIRNDVARKAGKDPNDLKSEEVMRAAFGTRFWRPNSPVTAYGVNQLVYKRGESLVYPRKPYVILTEGELNFLSCETELFTAIAVKPVTRVNLRRLLQNVRVAFVAVDADEAGNRYAEDIMKAMGGDASKIRKMVLPDKTGVNDLNDLLRMDSLSSFLSGKPFYLTPDAR